VIRREDDLHVAGCPEPGTASQGPTNEDALANLKEATALCLEDQEEPRTIAPPILTTFSVERASGVGATPKLSLPGSAYGCPLERRPIVPEVSARARFDANPARRELTER